MARSARLPRASGGHRIGMKLVIDTDSGSIEVCEGEAKRATEAHSAEGFALLTRLWLRAGWSLRYSYGFSWLGRPVIQLPEDLVRLQELLYRIRPDVVIETGVAHGGSVVFSASICRLLGRGRVIGIDREIRPANRRALEAHELAPLFELIEGSSTDPTVVDRVRAAVRPDETVVAILDSDHSKDHVRAELEAFCPLIRGPGRFVVLDGVMADLVGAPGAGLDWGWNNPRSAVREFLAAHADFEIEEPPFGFQETRVPFRVTYAPDGILRRK